MAWTFNFRTFATKSNQHVMYGASSIARPSPNLAAILLHWPLIRSFIPIDPLHTNMKFKFNSIRPTLRDEINFKWGLYDIKSILHNLWRSWYIIVLTKLLNEGFCGLDGFACTFGGRYHAVQEQLATASVTVCCHDHDGSSKTSWIRETEAPRYNNFRLYLNCTLHCIAGFSHGKLFSGNFILSL